MKDSKAPPKIKNYRILILTVSVVLILGIVVSVWPFPRKVINKHDSIDTSGFSLVKAVSAQELYPLFECPCCGKSIGECTCLMAKERRAFVDGLTVGNVAEDDAIISYIKKYGLESFMDENKREEFKEKLVQEAPNDRPIVAVSPGSYDFGDVSQGEGVVTTLFEIKNEGESDLIIDRLESSCGCTSASIIYQGEEGPKFSMPGHGDSEEVEDWQIPILSGETVQLKVYYDPSVHADFRGSATRTVSIFSNDPVEFEKKVQIDLSQVD